MDYIVRDVNSVGLKFSFDPTRIINEAKIINDEICYSIKAKEAIYHMFFIRYRLHREIYNHKTIKAIELLIVEILMELENSLNISSYLDDINKMILLDDMFIWNKNIWNDKIEKLINRIYTRDFPKLVYENISLEYENDKNLNIINTFDLSKHKLIQFIVGYVNENNSNPFDNIKFFNNDNNIINNDEYIFSLLKNSDYKEYFTRLYKF